MIYLDNAATTFPKPDCVHEAADRFARTAAVNAGRGAYRAAREAGAMLRDVKQKLISLCDARGQAEVVFSPSATVALNQIIHILLDNAVKYAGVGGEVTVSLKRRQNSVYLVTRNTGTPIPPEDLPHIFERFYRSDKARTAGGGYGLGLAICKNLAELHRAEITAASDETNGTVFTVRFKAGKK